MAKHEYYVVQGKTLDNVAETMKTVLGVDKDTPIRFDEVANSDKTEQINTDIETQTDLITRIKKALEGKASVSVAEIIALIDQSGVLDSTDGTATEKVEQLIRLSKWKNYIQQSLYTHTADQKALLNNADNPDVFELDFSTTSNLNHCFLNNQAITECDMDWSIVTSAIGCFMRCNNLKTVILRNTGKVKSFASTFSGCTNLTTLETLDCSNITAFASLVASCNKLVTLKFVAETIKASIQIPSPVLSDESIQSIIDGLATVETAQTLTLHKDVKAKLTETQLATITSKNWNLA